MIRYVKRCGDRQQSTNRESFTRVCDDAPEYPVKGRFQRIGNFAGFDFTQLITLFERLTFLDQPATKGSLLHGQSPLGHFDQPDHAHFRLP
ncbi:hypothetical protein D3C78_947960 [compost metagenome]